MSGGERLDSGTSRPSARLDAETRRAGVVAASWSIAQGWTEQELRDVLEGLGVLAYEPGGKTDRLGGHVFPRHRVAGDNLEESA